MAQLKYKTRGNSSPQGKPRVYFCCHHEDFNKYFESISDEILAKQNCAIWYTDEVVVRDEDFFADLKQMQLFVMPVTTNLLCTENEALDAEFKFAIENHIPVLPLMQERGLEELFNKKCGDLQFLDKHNHDITAIGYDEKLKKYLESVLIGDELAEKIRAAFDAYVFLSYRKKDRKYAQELMRLIHKNDFCRDIAIWYDEFLTPGENFNDSIKDALQKSGLFVLAVTPNLVNETNYIMTTEYPMAKQEGKPILPAEVVPTDRKQLSEKYQDIPNPADAHNEAELSEALLESIKKMAIKENDNSPEHNFFIGLAYLGGVDVEVDYEKAVALITSAADSGLIEAIEKLADIYHSGLGVPIDYEQACSWRELLVKKEYATYHQSHKKEDANCLISAFWELAEEYFLSGDYSKAIVTYEQAIELCKKVDNYLMLVNCAKSVVKVYQIQRRFEKAAKCIKKHKKYIKKAYKELSVDMSDFLFGMGITERVVEATFYGLMGEIYVELDNLKKAEIYFEKKIRLLTTEAKNDSNEIVAFGLIESKLNICNVLKRRYLETPANHLLLKVQKICSQCIQDLKKIIKFAEDSEDYFENERSLLLAYQFLGWVYEEQQQFDNAREQYELIVEKAKAAAAIYFDYETQNNLSVAYDSLGRVILQQGDLYAAKEYFENSLKIRRTMRKIETTNKSSVDMLCSLYYFGEVLVKLKEYDEVLDVYREFLEVFELMSKKLDKHDWFLNFMETGVAYVHSRMAEIYIERNEFEKAENSLTLAFHIEKESKSSYLHTKLDHYECKGYLCTQFGLLYSLWEQEARALPYFLQAIQLFSKRLRLSPDETVYIRLAYSHYSASILSAEPNDIFHLRKGLVCLEDRKRLFPDIEENIELKELLLQRLNELT